MTNYNSGWEPMPRKPDLAVFKTASGSLARRQNLDRYFFKALQNSEHLQRGLPKLLLALSSGGI